MTFENEESEELVDKAELSYVKGNYNRSAKLYGKLMEIEGEKPELLFNQLTALVHTSDTVDIKAAFQKLTNSDWLDCNYLSKNKDFTQIKYRNIFRIWQQAVRDCAKDNKNFNSKISHAELRQQLLWLKMQDAAADVNLLHKIRYGADNEKSVQELRLERTKIYVSNFFSLLGMIETEGWLGINEVGKDGAEAVWLITQHANHMREQQEELLVKMKVSVEAGNFEKIHYAHLYDRIQANKHQPQRYGTLRYRNADTGKWELYKLEDEDNLDSLRREMNLPPLVKKK